MTLADTKQPKASFPRVSAGASLLSESLFLRPVHKFWSMRNYAHENRCAESHLAMDLFFPEFSCGVMHLLRMARCALFPKNSGPFCKIKLDFGGSTSWNTQPSCPSVNQLSVYGAVADWCQDLALQVKAHPNQTSPIHQSGIQEPEETWCGNTKRSSKTLRTPSINRGL